MRKPAKKVGTKKPNAKKTAARKPDAKKRLPDKPYDEGGSLIRRMEEQLFHAEDREDGDEDTGEDVSERTVTIALETDGRLSMQSFERDLSARMHGDRDEEELRKTVTVPANAVARLAYVLTRERFKGEWSGERDFRTFCLANDIPFDDEKS